MTDDVPLYLSRYYDYDVLAQWEDWDEVTREVVLARVQDVSPITFFNPPEAVTLQAFIDTVLPQDDRPPERRVPILHYVDERLHKGEGDGYRHEDLPPDPEMWRLLARALDEEADLCAPGTDQERKRFGDLTRTQRAHVVQALHDEALRQTLADESWADIGAIPLTATEDEPWAHPAPTAAQLHSPLWSRLRLKFGWVFILWEIMGHYYGHPYAWSEIGFGGPRFPRIYARTLKDNPTEAQEVDLAPH